MNESDVKFDAVSFIFHFHQIFRDELVQKTNSQHSARSSLVLCAYVVLNNHSTSTRNLSTFNDFPLNNLFDAFFLMEIYLAGNFKENSSKYCALIGCF